MASTCDTKTLDAALSSLRAGNTPKIGENDLPAFFLHALAAMRKHAGPQADPLTNSFRNALTLRDRCGFSVSGQVEPWWIAAYLLSARPGDTIVITQSCPNPKALAQILGTPEVSADRATLAIHDEVTMAEPSTPHAERVLRFRETGTGNAIVRMPGAVIEIDDSSITDFIDITIAAYEPAEIAKLAEIPRRTGEVRAAPEIKSASFSELIPLRRDAERHTVSPIYDAYTPRRATFHGSRPHPADLIESKIFASIESPPLKNTLKIDKALVDSGILSGAQLEAIALADAAHSKFTPSGPRFGFYLADGTGVGKTNEQLGLYLTNYNQGRRRMIYVSEKSRHIVNVEKAIAMLGMPRRLLIDSNAYSLNDHFPNRDGIVYITYTRLREADQDENFLRIKQLIDWFGQEGDGLIVFDECHNLRNAIGDPNSAVFSQPPSLQGRAGVDLQDQLPNARIVYASATGISDLYNLAYMNRLALWGPETEFVDIPNFLKGIQKSGVSGLELIAAHLAASGLMISRTLSLAGVRAESLIHHFSDAEIDNWDKLAELLSTLRNSLPDIWHTATRKAITKKFNPDIGWIPGEAVAHFESAARRLAELALVSANTPTVIADMELAIARGEAPVVQLTNTYEAEADAEATTLHATIQRLIEQIVPINYLMKIAKTSRARLSAFVPIQDANGHPIPIPENAVFRQKMLEMAGTLSSPKTPLDQIFEAFGAKNVAEITGRTRRRVFNLTTGTEEIEVRNETSVRADLSAFMNDRKHLLVFSTGAGGSSMDYHAAKDSRNRRLRRHYLLQPGYRADQALQGIGRTHRSNQEQPPVIVLVSSNLPAERVYTSRTLDNIRKLGASTQGHRDANSATFNMRQSYNNEYARAAFVRFLDNLTRNTYPDLSCAAFEQAANMKLTINGRVIYTADDVFFRRLLTRLARCNLSTQRAAFSHIDGELEETLAKAIVDRTFDTGPEYISDQVEVLSQKILLTEPHTGATISATTISGARHSKLLSLEEAIAEADTYDIIGRPIRWAWSPETSRPFIQVAIEEDGSNGYVKTYRVIEPERSRNLDWHNPELLKSERIQAINIERMQMLWDIRTEVIQELSSKPSVILSGALPLIYGALSNEDGLKRPVIVDTSDGRRIMGVLTTPEHAASIGISAKTAVTRIAASKSSLTEIDDILSKTTSGKTVVFNNNWMINVQMALGKMRLELHVPTNEKIAVEKTARVIGFSVSKTGKDTRFLLPETAAVSASIRAILAQAPVLRVDDQPDWSLVA